MSLVIPQGETSASMFEVCPSIRRSPSDLDVGGIYAILHATMFRDEMQYSVDIMYCPEWSHEGSIDPFEFYPAILDNTLQMNGEFYGWERVGPLGHEARKPIADGLFVCTDIHVRGYMTEVGLNNSRPCGSTALLPVGQMRRHFYHGALEVFEVVPTLARTGLVSHADADVVPADAIFEYMLLCGERTDEIPLQHRIPFDVLIHLYGQVAKEVAEGEEVAEAEGEGDAGKMS